MSKRITIVYGDGIGPEIMSVVLDILKKAGADFKTDVIEMGEKVYQKGFMSGVRPKDWPIVRQNPVFLKAPISTPQGGGFKSLNVKVRKSLGLFANVRPVRSLSPYVKSLFPDMDVVILRENEEDLYAGIEHRQTEEVFQCLKLISLPGCEKIIRYSFEYARLNGRKKLSCMTKDNIMKLTDGTFRSVFEKLAKEYSDIESEHWIIDIGAAKFSTQPSNFDLIVLPNLYGDILSDISAQLAGSVGLGGSANIGASHAMFEAVHGSAPRRAGQDLANPSGLLNAAILMLDHIGEGLLAAKIHNAWLSTIEEGIHTYDIYKEGTSKQRVGTRDFGHAVVERLGSQPKELSPSSFAKSGKKSAKGKKTASKKTTVAGKSTSSVSQVKGGEKALHGIDVFICEKDRDPFALAQRLKKACAKLSPLDLCYITNRGIKVWPTAFPETFCVDHWRCRFLSKLLIETKGDLSKLKLEAEEVKKIIKQDKLSRKEQERIATVRKIFPDDLLSLLMDINKSGLEIIKTENLYSFAGKKGYSSI